MTQKQISAISHHFENVKDPRRENKRHKLIDIITIAICAVICNADHFEHIHEFGKAKQKWFKTFLKLPHGIPSADTFERVFAWLDPEEFKNSFFKLDTGHSSNHKRRDHCRGWKDIAAIA